MSVDVTYYTDPLCSWSWALEPVWRRLRTEYEGRLTWRYRMGGLIEDWDTFRDPMHEVQRPSQLAPLWYQVSQATGAPIDATIWQIDPPASSFPACRAVKAAERQGRDSGHLYLLQLREAVMCRRLNLARTEVLVRLADELQERAGFDARRFADDLRGDSARAAFVEDLRDTRGRGITRFPTLLIRGPRGARIVVGFRPFDMLKLVVEAVGDSPPPAASERNDASGAAGNVGPGATAAHA